MVELEDLPNVGPATVVRLRQAGYTSVEALAYGFSSLKNHLLLMVNLYIDDLGRI